MEKKARIWIKVIIVAVLSFLFIWLIYTDEKVLQLEQPEGELVSAKDVWILLRELGEAGVGGFDEETLAAIQRILGESALSEEDVSLNENVSFDENALSDQNVSLGQNVRYKDYIKILDLLPGEDTAGEEQDWKNKLTYKNKYKDDFYLLKKDWYDSYGEILKFYGMEDIIREEKIELLCGSESLAGEKKIEEGCFLDVNGEVYIGTGGDFRKLQFMSVRAYMRGNRLLGVTDFLDDKSILENVWIMEDTGEKIQFFYKDYEILADVDDGAKPEEDVREQVGDISFGEGKISRITVKDERIGGKLLAISEEQVEIEGYGSVPVAENCVGYQLYEGLRQAEKEELALGYDFVDFVLENGKICAFLIARKEKMETVRVAIKTSNFSSLYHDKIILFGQSDMMITYGDYGQREQEYLKAGQELVIEVGSRYLSGGRMEVAPEVNTGKIQVLSIERSQGTPAYRGKMEIVETKDGLVLINEVLMEEYLYSVVPSEMPSSYPMEALKAQAVCARTYGYLHLAHPGYGNLGAHMDDSVSYQVYNNILENVSSTKAVKETAGTLLLYEEEPVSTYYYSTSCGFGADAGVWNSGQEESTPYLKAAHIAGKEGRYSPEEMALEENFRDYIFQTDEDAYEKDEKWFRWHYYVDEADASYLAGRLRDRYAANASKVLTYKGEGDKQSVEAYEEKEPENFTEIYDIQCLKRRDGGVMDELLLTTDKGIYKVVSEYNIRYILSQGGEAEGQDGASFSCTTLLPSAYFAIDVVKNGENVIGYTLVGGGYGHGVGMSQNGARAMGEDGMNFEEILSFYYKECHLDKIY